MFKANIYLNFDGTTEAAFTFYQSVFGGEFLVLQRFKDIPNAPPLPEEALNKIMHVSLAIGDGNTLMGTDAMEGMGQKLTVGNNVSISLHPDSEAEARRLFSALSAGGKVEMELQDQFWGAMFGSFADKYGIQWMVNFERPQA